MSARMHEHEIPNPPVKPIKRPDGVTYLKLLDELLDESAAPAADQVVRLDEAVDTGEPPFLVHVPVGVAEADPDLLFELDNEVRRDVPGLSGWQGDRVMFDEELRDLKPVETQCYRVAVDRENCRYAGLMRLWQKRIDGETVLDAGLIGVRRSYRQSPAAALLARHSLSAAVDNGFATITARTARTSLQRRLLTVGAEVTGGSLVMQLPRN